VLLAVSRLRSPEEWLRGRQPAGAELPADTGGYCRRAAAVPAPANAAGEAVVGEGAGQRRGTSVAGILKFLGGVIGIIFLIGLVVVIGLLMLIF
jgi:hypothetical protein